MFPESVVYAARLHLREKHCNPLLDFDSLRVRASQGIGLSDACF